ncbi:MarR family transcriptional regulator, partial [Polymorphospora sp. NPDC051019]|uniref:MarR family transcriptional regulator n=1 Tax=Polymorphospora sp. NPDC051019 TaxID=3155725 RepID=UPI003416ECAB
MSTNTTTAAPTTTAVTVARTLANHPDGITVRDLAAEAGVGQSTASKALAAMEADGTATRTPGPTNGNRKSADIWHPATVTATDEPTPGDDAPETTPDATDEPTPGDDAPETTPDATDEPTPGDDAPETT